MPTGGYYDSPLCDHCSLFTKRGDFLLDLNKFLTYHDVVELVDLLQLDIKTSSDLLSMGELSEVFHFNCLHVLLGKVKRIKQAMEVQNRGK